MQSRSKKTQKQVGRGATRFVRMTAGFVMVVALLVAGFVYFSQETRAVAGDYAIYREATGLETVTSTLTNQAWDTTVSQAALYSIDAGRTTVTLSETGHYLAMYNLGVEIYAGTPRGAAQGYLEVNGTQTDYGRASCYIENQGGQTNCWMSGAAVIETTATNQTLKVQVDRLDDGTASMRRLAGTSGFTLLRLDNDWVYARVREVGGGQAFNTTAWATITFDTDDELDTGISRIGGDFTIAEAGKYLVTTNTHFVSSRASKNREAATRLTLNGIEIAGTRVTALMSGDNGSLDSVASFVGIVEATTTNQVMRLQGACVGDQCGQTTNAANGTAITIVKLPDTVETVMLSEATGGQQVYATNDPILWDTNDQIDTTAFSHSTTVNPARVTVNADDDYIFFSTFYSDRTVLTSTVPMDPHWEWRTNGTTKLNYGSFSHINKGDESNHGAQRSGASGGAIFTSLTSSDYVEVVNTNESSGTITDPNFQGGLMAFQGIRLSSLETPDIVVSAVGTQTATTSIPSADFYVGGKFAFVASHSFPTETITSIAITEKGTIDAANDISNIRLYYELDTVTPFDCASVSYDGNELQYGATSTSFSSANGSSTFSGSVVASTTQSMCVYVVLDVDVDATDAQTIEIEITDPENDVVLGGGPVGPKSTVAITGPTTLEDDFLTQIHYHWRNDDNTEALATSATGDTEDTVLADLPKGSARRIRLEVSNQGSGASPGVQYRLEYAQRADSCALTVSGWTDVDGVGGAWDMFDSGNLTNGNDTSNIILASRGAVTDEGLNFLSPNGAVRDTSSQTGSLVATSTQFIEFEYSVIATASAADGESYCFRVTDAGTPIADYDVYPEVSISADVLVSSLGIHEAIVDASTTDFYVGGAWVVTDLSGSRNVTDITINELGTVDAANDIANVRLYYDLDTSDPYNCASESYIDGATQYGATSTAFSSANGTSTFSEVVGISTTATMCVYAVVDVGLDASNAETIELEITNPGTEVVVSTGSVNPNTPVGPTGSTTIEKAVLDQVHFHWRDDDGTEAGASSATDGEEDTDITNIKKTETQRLRMEVNNKGGTSTLPTVFTLEYVEPSGSCAAASGWQSVGVPGGAWTMSDSLNLTNGNNTTNIATSTGGVSNENSVFLTPNGGVRDTQATTSSLILLDTNYLELEYAIEATQSSNFGTTYCFRLTSEGSTVDTHTAYPQATIRQNQDFYIQRGETSIPNAGTTVTITAGVDYVAPSASSSAFIRITNTMQTGAGRASTGGTQNADAVTAYVSDPENITSSITFTRSGSVSDTKVFWEIVEYTGPVGGDNEMIVRHAEAYTMGNKSLTGNIAATGVVDDADVVVFLTGQGNPQNNATDYQYGIVTTDWNGVTNEAVLTRNAYAGGPGNAAYVSFAVVEYIGSSWLIQRAEHTYSLAGTTQTQTIIDVNDLSRTFVHAQHRTTQNTVADFGHLVWLSGVDTVSFQINTSAGTPANHTSVAWVIENTQTNGVPMVVTRSSGSQSAGGTEASTYSISIGKTLTDLDVASILVTQHSGGADTQHPRAIMGVTIASTTHYELWISDTGQSRTYRTEIVEWPTAVLAVRQNYYRFYVDNDVRIPTDPWPVGGTDLGENTAITGLDSPPADGDRVRVRMSLNISGANFSAGQGQGMLEYGVRDTTCTAVSSWLEVGGPASTTAVWRGYNATPLDGTVLSTNPPTPGDLKLSVSDRAGSYEEESPTLANPYKLFIGEDVEYDWIVQANGVTDLVSYCFRMVYDDGATLDDYLYYPVITTAGFEVEQQDWRWFDDETAITPTVPLAASNTAPINISYAEALKLRVIVEEQAGRDGVNTKYKLQWSVYSDFSVVSDVVDMDECATGAPWCYYNGAGSESATITAKVLERADACVGGVGAGCGTHNEYSYTPDIVGEMGTTTTDNVGITVTLQHTYDDPVFIVESVTGDSTGGAANDPAAAIITATSTSSFTVRIQEPDNEADDHGIETVAYIVMERGAYQLPDGRRVDVDSLNTSQYYGNAVAGASDDTCSFAQTFSSAPVVLTALQTDNNTGTPDFLTVSQVLVTANDFACSIEVPDGETNPPGSVETIGWIAIAGGQFTNNTIDIVATTTSTSVTGWTDTPWYEELFSYDYFLSVPGILGNKQTRNGAEGGWLRYDTVDTESALLAIDERDDGERTHTSETVGYLAFATSSGTIYREGTSNFIFVNSTKKEFEFTITHNNALPNQTYFFRLYDVHRDAVVSESATTSFPSLSTEGATLTFSISGYSTGSSTEGVTLDATSTATSLPFGKLSIGVDKNVAQKLTVTTNATEGYQILAYERQDLTAGVGATINDISGTNLSPVVWTTGCSVGATSCYGYHVGDNMLSNGSTRFMLNDTYAALDGNLAEVAYSSGPVINESTDIIYRIRVSSMQPAGLYASKIVYIVVPVF